MTKSWWQERFPPHECQTCGLEHILIPGIKLLTPGRGDELITLYPFEVIGDATGTIHPGKEIKLDTPAKIVSLVWGTPVSTEVLFTSLLYLN